MQLIMIAWTLHYISKNDFKELLDMFYERYENYLKERSYDNYGKWHYKHRKLRRAYFSMRRNIELLFEFEMTKNIPKHNNSIEASFRWLKDSLNRHSGLKNRNKIRFIVEYFSIKNNR